VLRHVLENTNHKIGCIVNDVASVNIDAKLVRNDRAKQQDADGTKTTSDLADTVELANGCACCNVQDELFGSFEQLLKLMDTRGTKFDRFILENSGVAEPKNIREAFADAEAEGHPLMKRVCLDTMVTVVDSATFIADYSTRAPVAARPDLGEGGGMQPVVDLLVEQIECGPRPCTCAACHLATVSGLVLVAKARETTTLSSWLWRCGWARSVAMAAGVLI